MSASAGGAFAGVLGPVAIAMAFAGSSSSSSKLKMNTHMVTASMRIERYYSSVREEVSPLANDAAAILDAEDYVGFFKACGPNYVRGIRRVQEVTAIFSFQSQSLETARQFSASMKTAAAGFVGGAVIAVSAMAQASGKEKFKTASSSLMIKILGFGCGLGADGSETFVATKMEQYEAVMKYAFKAMTRNEDADHVGMVYGIEIVPWVHNTAFQVAAKLGDQTILIPMPRSMIPRAKLRVSPFTTWSDNNNNRDDYRCKDSTFFIDKYGYCCELTQLYDPVALSYTGASADQTTHVCRPFTQLDPSLIKDNMSNNGEFVSRLDAAMRYRLTSLAQLEKCVSAVHAIPEVFQYNYLKSQDAVKYDSVIPTQVTLMELKMAVDPQSDYMIVKHVAKEIDEWVEMFYSRCYAAIYGTNVGQSPDVDVSYFMAYPWYSHDECMHLSCISSTMRWDRVNEGCVPSLLSGTTSQVYPSSSSTTQDDIDDVFCARNIDDFENNSCKYSREELEELQAQTSSCWNNLPITNIDYMLTNFCLPQVTMEEPEDRKICDIRKANCACEKDGVEATTDTCFDDAAQCSDLNLP